MLQYASDHRIHDLFDRFRVSIEKGISRQNGGSGQQEEFEVFDVDQIQRGLARHENQLPFFFQHHIRGPQQHIFAITMCDAPNRTHSTRYHHHCVGWVGAAGKGCVHALQAVRDNAFGEAQTLRQFLGDYRMRVIAQYDMNFVLSWINVIEQALGVNRAAGSGYGDQKFQWKQ